MVDAMTSDCRVLLARFEEKHSVRFEDFCKVWKEMNFSLIHYARTREWERIQVAEYLFRILSNYLVSTCPLQYQVGAIYALYSVYNTQLVKPKVKIRMTLLLWKDLVDLQEKVKEQKHYDVHYVISFLRSEKAFIFVAMPIQLACGSRDAISVHERELAKPSNAVQNALLTLENVDQIDSVYNAIKKKICSPDNGEPVLDPVTLEVAPNDLVSHLQRDISEFQQWRQGRKQWRQGRKDSLKTRTSHKRPALGLPSDRKNATDLVTDQQTRSEKVRGIKSRGFKTVTQGSKTRRHRQHIGGSEKTKKKQSNKRSKR